MPISDSDIRTDDRLDLSEITDSEGPADGGAEPEEHDGGADGGAEGPADGGADSGEHDGGADGGA